MNMDTILVIAPHPDDEVLGCGGTIAKHVKAGHNVQLCIVTTAYSPEWSDDFLRSRPGEIKESNSILGIQELHTLDLPTVKLDTIPQQTLNKMIGSVIETVRPNVVYIPFTGDLHKDHRLVSEAALVALRPLQGSSVNRILFYETPSETEWGISHFTPTVYEDIVSFIDKKMEAMEAYKSEVKPFPHPRSKEALDALAAKRGYESGLKRAEAFVLVREINKYL